MKLVDVSVRRPIGLLMIVLGVIALGMVSLRNLAIDLFPKIELPIAVVATSYSGAAPEEVEKLVPSRSKQRWLPVNGIDTISSQSQSGASIVLLMSNGTDLDYALLEVRERIDQVKSFLPDGAGDPSVLRLDLNQLPVVQLALTGTAPERLQQIADTIIPYLERQDGVASVNTMGGKAREILVELDIAKIASTAYRRRASCKH